MALIEQKMSKVSKSVIIRVFWVAKNFLMWIFVISVKKYIYVPGFSSVTVELRHNVTYTDLGLFVLFRYHVTDIGVNPYTYQNDRKSQAV